ncbi:RNA helicase [Haematococcus lacustris]|uniref:ATP-dependent RNA helicase n=1 Tax=Haematococcus lacustris TaxID=44745 RepID=A0A6A0A1N2_HAELA|nr:RNA helicase [Haematococcus lacustris]
MSPTFYIGFAELPLSKSTLEGLEKHNYKTLTAVQRAALPHALTACTMSGTLQVLERLFRLRWTRFDGLGALILTPTRELALQIFQELRKVGASHDLSAGLLIGGKAVKEEAATINRMNILVATPGRLLQHMDETPGFDANSLQVLVLDEADRILDLGFAEAVDAILQNLPQQRQTLLFSATQTKSIKDLARLSLSDPEYVAVHAEAETATPLKLQQALAVVEAHHKVDTLWSFIKAHLAAKTIVFFSTCKQAFKKLRPGVPLRALHGGMKQMKRMVVYADFCQAEHMVLFATDIAGRGLDFPSVDWVLQVDCPEDAAAYIHRVGRTASEAPGMQAALAAAKIPIKTIRVNPSAQQCIGPALAALLSKSVELKEFAQRALVAYVRSLVLAPSKDVFADVSSLPLEQLASSWGLLAAPKMRFLKKVGKKRQAVLELGGAGGLQGTASPPAQELVPAVSEGGQHADTAQARVKGPEGYAAATGSREQPSSRVSKKAKAAAILEGQGKQQEAEAGEGVESGGQAGAKQLAAAGGVAWEIRSTAVGKAGKDAAQHGKPVVGERAEEDSGDELLTLKQRDVFSEAGDGEGVGGVASSFSSMAVDAGKKKKKLKIKVGRSTGQRMVFDADGVALRPLEALALDGLGPSAAAPDADPGDSVYAVRDNPADRFEVAAAAMHR